MSLRRDDAGFALVLVAFTVVVLSLFAAFAIDLGGLYNARRNDQNAADTAALGGVAQLDDPSSIVATVDSLASSTLEIPPGTLDWANGCPGSNADDDSIDVAVPGTTTGSSCITADVAGRHLQVRIPVQEYATSFAGVVGLDSFEHTAFAIAGLRINGFGSVLPYGLVAGAGGGGGYVCLKTGSGGHTGDRTCDGPDAGNFGYLDFSFFGSAEVNTATSCGSGDETPRKINNTAVGVDHDLSRYASGAAPWGLSEVVDTIACAAVPQLAEPNSVKVVTGNTPQEFGHAIFSWDASKFTDGRPARMQRTTGMLGWGGTQNVGGYQLDDNPLWEFITPGVSATSSDVPAACQRDQFGGPDGEFGTGDDWQALPSVVRSHLFAPNHTPLFPPDELSRRLLHRCFTHYNGGNGAVWTDIDGSLSPGEVNDDCLTVAGSQCTGAVFGRNSSDEDRPDLYDIQYTSRFGYVPQLLETTFGTGTSVTVHIATYRAIWMQRLLAGQCTASGGCSHSFDPGIDCSCTTPAEKSDGMTVFVFPRNMLPNGLAEEDAPFAVGKNRFVQLVR